MRRAAAVDANQSEIVGVLRDLGASVALLYQLGGGVPDVLVGYEGRDCLVEIKDGSKPPSARRLTDHEARWIGAWHGRPVEVVGSVAQAMALITRMREREPYALISTPYGLMTESAARACPKP